MKKLWLITLLVLCSSVFARKTADTQKLPEGYLPSARACIDGLYPITEYYTQFQASLLIWQAKEDGLAYAAVNSSNNPSIWRTKQVFPDFDWAPAVKVGAAFGFKNGWDLSASYIYYDNSSKASTNAIVTGASIWSMIPFFQQEQKVINSNVNSATSASGKWDITLNSLDVLLSYPFAVSPQLSLKISGGFKGAMIDQTYDIDYTSPTNALTQVRIKNDSIGGGGKIGCASSWNLNSQWSLDANIAGSFLYTRFETTNNILSSYKLKNDDWMIKPALESLLGVSWHLCFGKNNQNKIQCSAAYEIQYFWEQNLIWRYTNLNMQSGGRYTNGDLIFQGANLTLSFGF